jgi:SAM-dependent methyltransferase
MYSSESPGYWNLSLVKTAVRDFSATDIPTANPPESIPITEERNILKARHSAEPWFSRAVNYGIGSDPEEVRIRKEMLTDYIAASGFSEKAKNKKAKMLDYGGDRGQFIPDVPNTEKYCFELSDAEPLPQVVKFSSFDQFSNMKFDIVLCSEVLEHLSDPVADIEKIGSLLEENSQAYFEVPYEIYSVPKNMGTGWYGKYLELVSKSKILTIGIDFLSTIFRVKMGFVPFFGFVKQHEHINFYTEKGLKNVLERNGFEVSRIEIVNRRSPSGVSRTLSCLAKKNKSA